MNETPGTETGAKRIYHLTTRAEWDEAQADGLTVRFEDGGNGKLYPHIYAPLPCRLVDDLRPAFFDEQGRFVFAQ